MLPEKLSNGLCSLNPGVDRLVLSAILETRPEGPGRRGRVRQGRDPERRAHDLHGGRAAARDASRRAADERPLRPAPRRLPRHGGARGAAPRERRDARGSIDFDLPDADVVLDDAGLVVGIVPESRNVAHRLIEEFMLAANEAVAKQLLFAKQPAIYRVHDRPDPDRLADAARSPPELRLRAEGRPRGGSLLGVPEGPEGDRGKARGAPAVGPAPARAAQGASTARSAAATTRSRRPTTATSPRRSGGIRT